MNFTLTPVEGPSSLTVTTQETRATSSYDLAIDGYDASTSALATEWDVYDYLAQQGYRIGQQHPTRYGFWLVGLDAQHNTGIDWRVSLSYSSNPGQSVINRQDDPFLEAARISWDGENFQQTAVVDKDLKPILNSAGDPYDPPLMKDFSRPVATVRKYVTQAPAWILSAHDAVNSGPFVIDGLTVAEGKAKLKRVHIGEAQYRNGVAYRELTLVLHFSKDGWVRKVLDSGFRRIYSGTNRELITITAEDGSQQYPVAPVPLDGSGVELTDPTPTTCVYNEHDLDEAFDFSALPLT